MYWNMGAIIASFIYFFPGVFFHCKLTAACPVTTDSIMQKLISAQQHCLQLSTLSGTVHDYSILSTGTPDLILHGSYMMKIKIHSSCEIEDFFETHLGKLCVILRSRVLRVVCTFRAPEPLPIQNSSNFVPKNGFPVAKGLRI